MRSKIAGNSGAFSKWLSDDNLTKKAFLNALAAVLDYGARLIVGFVTIPLLVAGLGDYLYGAWRILGRLTGYISAASGRPTQALKWTIANQQASTKYEEKRRNVGSAVAVWLLFLPLLVTLGGSLAWFAPSLLDAPMEFYRSVRLAAGLLVANLIVINLTEVPQSVLRGENLGYKRMGLSTILVFIGGGLIALALYLKTGIVGVVVATLTNALLTGGLFLQVVRSYVPWFGIAKPTSKDVRRLFGLSWWFLVWRLVMQLMMASDVVLLGMLNSVELVTIYSLVKYTPETLTSFVAIMVGGVTPGLGGIIGSREFQKAVRLRSEIMSLTWLVATVMGATILLWNGDFVQLWAGEKYWVGPISNLLVVLMVMQFVLIRNDANLIDLTLNLRRKVLLGALSATASLVIAGILVGSFDLGIPGLCLGFIGGRSILSLGYPWLVGRFLGVSFNSQLKSVLRPAFITALLFIVVLSADDVLTVSTWIGLIVSVGVTLVVVSSLAFYTGLSRDQRMRVLQRVRGALRS